MNVFVKIRRNNNCVVCNFLISKSYKINSCHFKLIQRFIFFLSRRKLCTKVTWIVPPRRNSSSLVFISWLTYRFAWRYRTKRKKKFLERCPWSVKTFPPTFLRSARDRCWNKQRAVTLRERQRAREAVKVHTYANTFYFQFSAILFSTPFPFLEYFFYSRIIRSSIVFQVKKKKKERNAKSFLYYYYPRPFRKGIFQLADRIIPNFLAAIFMWTEL